jgi:hypothetical protein
MEADPADHARMAACDRCTEQPSVVGALADLIPPTLEHVAVLGRPFWRVSDSDVFEERLPVILEHLLDDWAQGARSM